MGIEGISFYAALFFCRWFLWSEIRFRSRPFHNDCKYISSDHCRSSNDGFYGAHFVDQLTFGQKLSNEILIWGYIYTKCSKTKTDSVKFYLMLIIFNFLNEPLQNQFISADICNKALHLLSSVLRNKGQMASLIRRIFRPLPSLSVGIVTAESNSSLMTWENRLHSWGQCQCTAEAYSTGGSILALISLRWLFWQRLSLVLD